MSDRDDVTNLFAIDQAVARGARAVAAWRSRLGNVEAALEEDPYQAHRKVAGKALHDALGALTPSLVDQPLRDGLRRWIAELTVGRVSREAEVRRAEALAAPTLRVRLDVPRTVSPREALRGLVRADSAVEGALWLGAWAGGSGEAAAAERERAEVRLEAARRLGLEHPSVLATDLPIAALREAAESVLHATADLATDLLRDERKREGGAGVDAGILAYLAVARARDASEGWPARLQERWLADVFSALRFPRSVPVPVPEVVGASSFARALESFGAATVRAWTPRGLPFVLRAPPFAPRPHLLGATFGSLAASPTFHQRALGLGRGRAVDQSRVVGRALLLESRARAVRFLLGDPAAPPPKGAFEELTASLFGAPLPSALRGVWPFVRDDEAARFAALLRAPAVLAELEGHLDDDWFRNPRLGQWIERFAVAIPDASAEAPPPVLPEVTALRASLERLVG